MRPEIDWDQWDVRRLLLISRQDCTEWGIIPERGPQIIWHDVRQDEWSVIAGDLAEACIQDQMELEKIRAAQPKK